LAQGHSQQEEGFKATVALLNARGAGRLPGYLGIEIVSLEPGKISSSLVIRPEHLAPNGYLHAATAVALADTSCGYGAVANMPPGGQGFTTIELKSNFIGTARSGTIVCEAHLIHKGRTTQVWDAEVKDEATQRVITLFRCTQMILYPAAEK
jgi:1,4-dihydroxy-2-naphthoyl-CoA hydrolase